FVDCYSAATEPRLAWTHREKNLVVHSSASPQSGQIPALMAGRAAGDRISLHDQVGGAPDLVPIARARRSPTLGPHPPAPGPSLRSAFEKHQRWRHGESRGERRIVLPRAQRGMPWRPGVAFAGAFPLFAPSAH